MDDDDRCSILTELPAYERRDPRGPSPTLPSYEPIAPQRTPSPPQRPSSPAPSYHSTVERPDTTNISLRPFRRGISRREMKDYEDLQSAWRDSVEKFESVLHTLQSKGRINLPILGNFLHASARRHGSGNFCGDEILFIDVLLAFDAPLESECTWIPCGCICDQRLHQNRDTILHTMLRSWDSNFSPVMWDRIHFDVPESLLHKQGICNDTPLAIAVKTKNLQMSRKLLQMGACVDPTVLRPAIRESGLQNLSEPGSAADMILKELVELLAKNAQPTEETCSILSEDGWWLFKYPSITYPLLTSQCLEANAVNLGRALKYGDVYVVRIFLERGAPASSMHDSPPYFTINGYETRAATPMLNIAVANMNLKLVELLVQCGADVNLKDVHGDTALHVALRQFACPTDPPSVSQFRGSQLHWSVQISAESTWLKIIAALLQHSNVADTLDNSGNAPFLFERSQLGVSATFALARVYLEHGHPRIAKGLVDQASLRLCHSMPYNEHQNRNECIFDHENPNTAEDPIDYASFKFENCVPRNSLNTLECIYHQGKILIDLGRLEAAKALFSVALKSFPKISRNGITNHAVMIELYRVHRGLKDIPTALKWLQSAEQGYKTMLGTQSVENLSCQYHLADCYQLQGELEKASEVAYSMAKSAVIGHGGASKVALQSIGMLGRIRSCQDEHRMAEKYLLHALHGLGKLEEPVVDLEIELTTYLSALYRRQGRAEEASSLESLRCGDANTKYRIKTLIERYERCQFDDWEKRLRQLLLYIEDHHTAPEGEREIEVAPIGAVL